MFFLKDKCLSYGDPPRDLGAGAAGPPRIGSPRFLSVRGIIGDYNKRLCDAVRPQGSQEDSFTCGPTDIDESRRAHKAKVHEPRQVRISGQIFGNLPPNPDFQKSAPKSAPAVDRTSSPSLLVEVDKVTRRRDS